MNISPEVKMRSHLKNTSRQEFLDVIKTIEPKSTKTINMFLNYNGSAAGVYNLLSEDMPNIHYTVKSVMQTPENNKSGLTSYRVTISRDE